MEILGQGIQSLLGASNKVQNEKKFPNQDSGTRPDITITTNGARYFIDVTIVNPACSSSVAHGSSRNVLATATYAEAAKRRKYANTLRVANVPGHRFIPFAIEATGRLGNEAANFLKLVASESIHEERTKQRYLHYCKKRMRAAILRGNAWAKNSFLLNLVEMRGKGDLEEVHNDIVEETKTDR